MFANATPLFLKIITDAMVWSIQIKVPLVRSEHLFLAMLDNPTSLRELVKKFDISSSAVFDLVEHKVPKCQDDWGGMPLTFDKQCRNTFEEAKVVMETHAHICLATAHLGVALTKTLPTIWDEFSVSTPMLRDDLEKNINFSVESADEKITFETWKTQGLMKSLSAIQKRDPANFTHLLIGLNIPLGEA